MTLAKIVEVTQLYEETLQIRFGVTAEQNQYPDDMEQRFEHIRWMCREIRKMAEDRRIEKAMRWLGFVQGVLWTHHVFTLDDMKAHNRNDCLVTFPDDCQD